MADKPSWQATCDLVSYRDAIWYSRVDFCNILGRKWRFMYRNVLLTDKEIAILKTVISQTLHEKVSIDRNNLTIIYSRLRQITPLKKYNQSIN